MQPPLHGSHWALSTSEAGSLLPTGRNQTLYGLCAHLIALGSATATEAVCHFLHTLGIPTHPALPSGTLPVSSWASDLVSLSTKRGPYAIVDVKVLCDRESKLVHVGLLSRMLFAAGCSRSGF